MSDVSFATPTWRPYFFDYLYVSFTNATAFSPTDTMPLTRKVKALMTLQSAIALSTTALVIARAVNILKKSRQLPSKHDPAQRSLLRKAAVGVWSLLLHWYPHSWLGSAWLLWV